MYLSREELLILVRQIISFSGSEREYAELQTRFCDGVRNPIAVEMFMDTIDPQDAERIVEIAMVNKQINL